jgi:DNA-binding beta-propeller fold protein YncE
MNPAQYTLTVTQSAHGTISPATASYAQGASQNEVITPDSGYYIASITVDGNPIAVATSSGQTVSFNNIQTAHTITATFAQNSYILTVNTAGQGSVALTRLHHTTWAMRFC